jgi:hypothetical protein
MLAVATVEVGYPVTLLILMEADDAAIDEAGHMLSAHLADQHMARSKERF